MIYSYLNFKSNINIFRIVAANKAEQIGLYNAEIEIWCTECHQPFTFIGFEKGFSDKEARLNMDENILRIPIRPLT